MSGASSSPRPPVGVIFVLVVIVLRHSPSLCRVVVVAYESLGV